MAEPSEFEYQSGGDERVFIYHRGCLAETLSGRSAVDFLLKVERSDAVGAQLLMARATGNYKRGSGRAAKKRRG